MSPSVTLKIASAVIVASVSYLLLDTMPLVYQYPVDEVIVAPAKFSKEHIRVQGFVARDSIAQRPGTLQYFFKVGANPFATDTMPVLYTGVVPDTFKSDADVVVTGQLGADGTFVASDLLAKCPSKYEAAEKQAGRY